MKLTIPLTLAGIAAVLMLQGCAPAVIVGGAAVGASAAHDRRTVGTLVEDQEIELKAANAKYANPDIKDHSHIAATSYNMVVLLTGQVDDPAVSEKYEALVRDLPRVKRVVNEVTAGPFATAGQISEDALITSRAKLALTGVKIPDFDPTRVKVKTEMGVVYLMGLVTRAEADAASEQVRRVRGVSKVVKVFEYIQAP